METPFYNSKLAEFVLVCWSLYWFVAVALGIAEASCTQSTNSFRVPRVRLPSPVVGPSPLKCFLPNNHNPPCVEPCRESRDGWQPWKSRSRPDERCVWSPRALQGSKKLPRCRAYMLGFVEPHLMRGSDLAERMRSRIRDQVNRTSSKGLQLLRGSPSRDWLSLRLAEYAENVEKERQKVGVLRHIQSTSFFCSDAALQEPII